MWRCLNCGVGSSPDQHRCRKADIKKYQEKQRIQFRAMLDGMEKAANLVEGMEDLKFNPSHHTVAGRIRNEAKEMKRDFEAGALQLMGTI